MREQLNVSEEVIGDYENPLMILLIDEERYKCIGSESYNNDRHEEYFFYYERISDRKTFRYCYSFYYNRYGDLEEKQYDDIWEEVKVREVVKKEFYWDEE